MAGCYLQSLARWVAGADFKLPPQDPRPAMAYVSPTSQIFGGAWRNAQLPPMDKIGLEAESYHNFCHHACIQPARFLSVSCSWRDATQRSRPGGLGPRCSSFGDASGLFYPGMTCLQLILLHTMTENSSPHPARHCWIYGTARSFSGAQCRRHDPPVSHGG